MIVNIHEVVSKSNTPIQFIFFVLYRGEFRSLLVHFVPIVHSGKVRFIQMYFSGYDTWVVEEVYQKY